MRLKMILFDLDGTLLPMDQERFVKHYLQLLGKRFSDYGYEPKKLGEAIWAGTFAMMKNDGKISNEDLFWNTFATLYGPGIRTEEPKFTAFYEQDFDQVQASCGFTPKSRILLDFIKSRGCRVALATNPIFPAMATKRRILWAGLQPEDFELITTYENSRFCKPNPEYYRDILKALNLSPEECLMVGNDATEDLAANKLGIPVFLLTDCLINRNDLDISAIPHGSFEELTDYLDPLL